WSPDGNRIASVDCYDLVRIWDARSGECLKVLVGHTVKPMKCAWSPDGSRLASASEDATLRIWDPQSGECLFVLKQTGVDWLLECSWSPDGRRIVYSASVDLPPESSEFQRTGIVGIGGSFRRSGQRLQIWDGLVGRHLGTLEDDDGGAECCA